MLADYDALHEFRSRDAEHAGGWWARHRTAVWRGLLVAVLVVAQSISMVYFKKVSALMPSGAFLLTQMQPVGCGFGFGVLVLLRAVCVRFGWLSGAAPVSRAKQPGYAAQHPVGVRSVALFGASPSLRRLEQERSYGSRFSAPMPMNGVPDKAPPVERRPTPWWAYVFIATCLCLQNFLNRTGSRGNLVPGPMMLLLQQTVVPVTMVASIVFLKKRFRVWHYLGVALILGGMVMTVIPHWAAFHQGAKEWAVMLIVGASFPSVAAFIRVEAEFARGTMEVLWGWFIINLWQALQFLVGLLLFFALPLDENISLSQAPHHVLQSMRCFFVGHNDVGTDDCSQEGMQYVVYFVFNTSMNLTVALVLKHLGATVSYVAMTAALPLADLMFSSRLFMGTSASRFSVWSLAALAVVVVGLAVYRATEEVKAPSVATAAHGGRHAGSRSSGSGSFTGLLGAGGGGHPAAAATAGAGAPEAAPGATPHMSHAPHAAPGGMYGGLPQQSSASSSLQDDFLVGIHQSQSRAAAGGGGDGGDRF